MKKIILCALGLLCACNGSLFQRGENVSSVSTQREKAYYLTTQADQVQDTCPGHDIFQTYTCTSDVAEGMECFDVYQAEGSPVPTQRYTLIQETVQAQPLSAQPQCPSGMQPTCEAFLKALDYNLEFSWYLANFPSSSFAQCSETYDCKRIDCYLPATKEDGTPASTLVSCVYKQNQVFFVGGQITCASLKP